MFEEEKHDHITNNVQLRVKKPIRRGGRKKKAAIAALRK